MLEAISCPIYCANLVNLFSEESDNSSQEKYGNKPSGFKLGYEKISAAILFNTLILHPNLFVVNNIPSIDLILEGWRPPVDITVPREWIWATILTFRNFLVMVVSVSFFLERSIFFLLITRGLNFSRLISRF
jgi:hypothetical protein